MWILHDAHSLIRRMGHRARRVIVYKAKRMTGLMRGKLANAFEYHRQSFIVDRVRYASIRVRRKQSFGQQVVLASPQATQSYVAFQNLPGSRIGDFVAVAPSTIRSVHPLDDVVTRVHWIGIGWQ